MDVEKTLRSWRSAIHGLMVLASENMRIRPLDKLTIPLRAGMTEEEKEKVKEALDFVSYVLDIEVKKKKKGLFG